MIFDLDLTLASSTKFCMVPSYNGVKFSALAERVTIIPLSDSNIVR